jgi:transcriptional regulator with XRE-family HTH domain
MAKRTQTDTKTDPAVDNVLVAFGGRVREARKKAALTQAELAAAAGLSHAYVFEVETRGSNMSLKGIIAIANACKVALKDLMPETEFHSVTAVPVVQLAKELMEVLVVHQKDMASPTVHLNGYLDLTAQLKLLTSTSH